MARVKLRCIMGCPGLKSSYREKGLLWSFLISGTGKQPQSESGQICDESPWLKNYLNWIRLN